MDNKIEEIMKEMDKLQVKMFEFTFYENGNIEKFIKQLKEIKLKTICDDYEDEKYKNFIGKEIQRLEIITLLFYTKKLRKQKEDLKPLGR